MVSLTGTDIRSGYCEVIGLRNMQLGVTLMPSQKLFAVSRTFFTYAPRAPGVSGAGIWVSAISDHQLEVKSNLSPVSRKLCATRCTNSTTTTTAAPASKKRMAIPTAGAERTISIHPATNRTLTKLAGTRYFQHMFII